MTARKTVGIQRRCPGCLHIFVVCTSCDRGHRYCSSECKTHGRRESWKRSTKLYRITVAGKISHCERQKRYRKNRQLKISETQHPSENPKKSLQISPVHQLALGFGSIRKSLPSPAFDCFQCHRNIRFFINSS